MEHTIPFDVAAIAADGTLIAERSRDFFRVCLISVGLALLLAASSVGAKQGLELRVDIGVASGISLSFAIAAVMSYRRHINLAALIAGVGMCAAVCAGDLVLGYYTDKMWFVMCAVVLAGFTLSTRVLWLAYALMLGCILSVPALLPGHPVGTDTNPSRILDIVVMATGVTILQVLHIRSVLRAQHRAHDREAALAEQRRIAESEAARAAQSAEEAAHANATKSMFLANMSHELRTPLNAIIGYTELIQEDAEDLEIDAFDLELDRVHSASRHLLTLINDILDLSKIEAGSMDLVFERIDLAALYDEVASTVAPLVDAQNNDLTVMCDAAIGDVVTDRVRLRQVLLNLLSNAAKFTEHGEITLRAELHRDGHEEWVVLEVEDTGIGMSEEALARVFEAFTQANASTSHTHGGTGLGLTLCREICVMMGGDITATSAAGQGSCFTVRVPRVQAPDGRVDEADQRAVDASRERVPAT